MRPDLQMETNVPAATVEINDSVITCEKPTKIRWGILTLVYFSVFVAYMDRINLSVCAPLVMKDLGIDKVQLGMSMSAFFLSYWLLQIPGAMLSERFGIRKVGTIAILLWSLFTFLTPLALGFTSLLIIRFLFGVGEGPLLPNNGVAIAKWAGSKEKGIATGFMVGGAMLGPMVGPAVTVWIMTTWNWSMVFFSFGVLGIAMAAIWYGFVRDYPEKHPGVNQAELKYIGEGTTTPGDRAKGGFY